MTQLKVYNPYTKESIGEISLMEQEQLQEIVEKAKDAFQKTRVLSTLERKQVLEAIIHGMYERQEEIITTMIAESAKPRRYAEGEFHRAIATLEMAIHTMLQGLDELLRLDRTSAGKDLMGQVMYEPIGIVLGISPFNFPLNLAVHKIAPAIATGCAIILKPSSKTPFTMTIFSEIVAASGYPKNGFQLVHTNRENGNYLIKHPAIQLLSFTGSPEVGWEMKARAGKKRVVLELGGNAAAIVGKSANINNAAEQLFIGAFAYAGQVCIHTQRIYIHQSHWESFKQQFIEKAKQLSNIDPLENTSEFSVMIDEENARRVEDWVTEALDNGAKCLFGGKRIGNYMPPTVLTNVAKGQKVLAEEVFGPVVVLRSFERIEEAISSVNDSRWGLQAAIYTDEISELNHTFKQLKVGALIHNRATTFRVDEMPYGGVKDSGFGREGGKWGFMDYLEPKLLVTDMGNVEG